MHGPLNVKNDIALLPFNTCLFSVINAKQKSIELFYYSMAGTSTHKISHQHNTTCSAV